MNQSGTTNDIGSILVALIGERGNALLENRRRLFGLLRDRAPGSLRESRILMMAYDDGLPGRLRTAPVSDIEVAREAARFSNNTGISAEFARGAVIAWARALTGYQPAAVAAPPAAPLPPPVQPVQPVSVQPIPIQPLPVQPLPVQPLPVQPAPVQMVQAIPQAQAPGVSALPPVTAPNADLKKWIGIAVVVVAAMAGVSMMSDTFSSKPQPTAPQQPQQPQQQPQQPQQPRQPQTAGATPEGVTVLTSTTPYPVYKSERIQNDPNSIVFDLGVPTASGPMTYRAAILFKSGASQGLSRLVAIRNGQTTQVDHPAVRKPDSQNRNYSVVIGGGSMVANAVGAAGLCIVVLHTAPRTDRLDLTNEATVCALSSPGANGNACGESVGCATLR